jgi:hypothetical protein
VAGPLAGLLAGFVGKVGLLFYEHASPDNVARAFDLYITNQNAGGTFGSFLQENVALLLVL